MIKLAGLLLLAAGSSAGLLRAQSRHSSLSFKEIVLYLFIISLGLFLLNGAK